MMFVPAAFDAMWSPLRPSTTFSSDHNGNWNGCHINAVKTDLHLTMTSSRNDSAMPRAGVQAKIFRFVLTVVIAMLLGPLIGGIGFFLVSVAIEIAQSRLDVADIGGMFLLFVVGAYVVGGVIAFFAGTIVAVAALWRSPTFSLIVAATFVANVICYLTIQPGVSYSTGGFLVNLAASVFAAAICWAMFRRTLRSP
jgi:hypothetical protein